jgi:predicted AAA+ superfamily ATPase
MQPPNNINYILSEFWQRLDKLQLVERANKIKPTEGKATTLIGMRRSGKTYTLYNHNQFLIKKEKISPEQILFLNLEDDRLQIQDATQLSKIIDFFYSSCPENYDRQTYIFLDEIQTINNWEKVARRLVETNRCELWLTGSSAKMLSKDVATQFRGRSISYEIWPYDFFEYLDASKIKWENPTKSFASRDISKQQLENYLFEGGFPETIGKSHEIRQRILKDYRDIVILRDVIERHKVANLPALNQLVSRIVAQSGNLFSINKLANDFKSQGMIVNKDTLFQYLTYLEDAFFAFPVPIYNASHRISSTSPKKIFCIDTGMVSNSLMRQNTDLGRLFENLIFIDLKRKGYRIYYYQTNTGKEVDFIIMGDHGTPYVIQVCFDASDDKTFTREHQSLEEAKAELNCDGILVTPQNYALNKNWVPQI